MSSKRKSGCSGRVNPRALAIYAPSTVLALALDITALPLRHRIRTGPPRSLGPLLGLRPYARAYRSLGRHRNSLVSGMTAADEDEEVVTLQSSGG